MTLHELYNTASRILEEAGVPDASHDAFRLIQSFTGIDRSDLIAHGERQIDDRQAEKCLRLIEKRAERVPLQHLIGETGFMGLSFTVHPHVLIPRPDTEILVETALEKVSEKQGGKILDIGCGSGCILISLLHYLNRGSDKPLWKGVGSDLSSAALEAARINGHRNHQEALVTWTQSDLFDELPAEAYSLIVSNPPYIPSDVIKDLEPEVRDYDPLSALDGGEDGLSFYRRMIPQAGRYLDPGGWLVVEIGYDQKEPVEELFGLHGFSGIECRQDLAGLDRVIAGHMLRNVVYYKGYF